MKYTITISSQQYVVDRHMKEQYERYIQKLGKSLDDAEQLQDIEARIAELLTDMQVKPGDKIEQQHLSEVFGQLGDPQSFEDKPIVDTAQHQRTAIMRVMGVGLAAVALLVTIFTVVSVVNIEGDDTFPGSMAEWLYATAGLLAIGFFVALCVAAATGLLKTHFTQSNKRFVRLAAQGFIASFIMIFIGAAYIAVTN